MKKPMLAVGIIMIVMVALQSKQLPWGFMRNEKLNPSPCRAVLLQLEKRLPANWKPSCEQNNLALEVQELEIPNSKEAPQALLYRQLANHLVELAKASPDQLEKVPLVRVRLNHPKLIVNALSEGKYVAKLATLTTPQFIMEHLKATVQVKEDLP